MEEKRNVTICFNADDMYIVNFFQQRGKLSTEMKRVLKDYVDNNRHDSDLDDVLDTRLGKILSIIVGNSRLGFNGPIVSPELLAQLNGLQQVSSSVEDTASCEENKVEDEEDCSSEVDSFSLPPTSMIENIPFFNIDIDEDEEDDE